MATTLTELIDTFVYEQLQDKDNKVRWTRDELTQYANLALRDIVMRRPEAGVVVDTNLHLVEGARQTLPSTCVRLRAIVCNVEKIVTPPTIVSAAVNGNGTQITAVFSLGVQA